MDSLPDDLLVQILSFLPTKQAVSTSLLSRRWRTLFSLVHNLDFDDSIFWHPEDDIQKSFMDFMDRSLAFQGGNNLKKFLLECIEICGGRPGVDVVKRWICNALEHGLSELHLCINTHCFYFPSKLFTSKTLVKLSLGTRLDCPRIPPDTFLPALKVLKLDSISFWGNQLSDVFLAACPALEDFTIHSYPRERDIISSKTIKRLSVTIKSYYNVFSSSIISVLDTP
ncbi:unnamed protein product, partial [Arabidopsis halleri]